MIDALFIAICFLDCVMDLTKEIEDCQRSPRAIAALADEYLHGHYIGPHRHRRAQLIHALTGVMTVVSDEGSWIVPCGRAVWMPAETSHAVRFFGGVSMRTVYVTPDARPDLPVHCKVIEVSPLLRETIVAATRVRRDYAFGGRDHRVMELILDEVAAAPCLQLHVPLPRGEKLMKLCEALIESPARQIALDDLAAGINVSGRTLARLFQRELGMSFTQWLRRMRILLSLPRLAAGASVAQVALEHGYDSPSAYSAMFRRELGAAPTAYLSGAP
ncbi:AraC-like DNA-binding protein [Paraburkholderia youngii]|uniref:AraC family transcriptional regulator n=1 Tax=Paraburkholderia youngii TaxID=2782701 RepID=UPI003D198543